MCQGFLEESECQPSAEFWGLGESGCTWNSDALQGQGTLKFWATLEVKGVLGGSG